MGYKEGKGKGFRSKPDQVQMPGKKGRKHVGRVENREVPLVRDVKHSASQESGEKPCRESDI